MRSVTLRRTGTVALLTAEDEVDVARRIEVGLFLEEKLQQGVNDPTLQSELVWLVNDGRRAKNHFIEANLRLSGEVPDTMTSVGVTTVCVPASSKLTGSGRLRRSEGKMRVRESCVFGFGRDVDGAEVSSWFDVAIMKELLRPARRERKDANGCHGSRGIVHRMQPLGLHRTCGQPRLPDR